MPKGYLIRQIEEVEPVPCPCGSSTRPITIKDTPLLNFHVTHIMDSKKHYHKEVTEVYYILEGSGFMELNDETVPIRPGTVILIEPYTAHRGYGDFKTIVVGVPAARHDDEFFVEEDDLALAGASA
jgi:mannose-6-phosphate isomerase-like protein (cupin superfamily)